MTSSRVVLRYLLMVGMVLAGFVAPLAGSPVGAQTVQVAQSPMTGITIEAFSPWTIDTTSVMSEGGVESITIEGEYEFMQVWFMPGNTDLVQARDIILDSFATTFGTFVTVDRGAYGNVSYSLDMTSSEGIEFGVFSLFLGQRSSGYVEYYVFFGAVPTFSSGFVSAQQNVTVGGVPVFEGVDGSGLQNFLVSNQGVTGASSQTQAAPPTPAPTTTTQQPANQPPVQQQPSDVPANASADGDAYLATLESELVYLETAALEFLTSYMALETDPQGAAQELQRIAAEWDAYPERAASIVAPAGYESIDAAYRDLVTEVDAIGALWSDVIVAAQNDDPAFGTMMADAILRVAGLQTQIDDLRLMMPGESGGQTPGGDTQSPQDSPNTTVTDGPASNDGAAYIEIVRSETAMLETSLNEFLAGYLSIVDGTAPDPDATLADLNGILDMWAAYPDTAVQYTAPAGYEDLDAGFQQLAGDFSSASDQFRSAMQLYGEEDNAGGDAAFDEFLVQVDDLYVQIETVYGMLDQHEGDAGSAGPQTDGRNQTTVVDEPTEEPANQSTSGSSGSADEDEYVAAMTGEIADIRTSLIDFSSALDLLASDDPNEQDTGGQQMTDILEYWSAYPDVAATIVAPAGYEDVDEQYQDIAATLPGLAGSFITFLEAGSGAESTETFETFSQEFEAIQLDIDTLETMLGEASSGANVEGEPAGDRGEEPQNSPMDEPVEDPADDPQDEPTNISETGTRGQIPEQDDDDPGQQSASGYEDLGLVADDEYVSPQFGVEITWDERWEFAPEVVDDPIGSDDYDWITVTWVGGDDWGDVTVSTGEAEDGIDPASVVEYWGADETLEDAFEDPAEVLLIDESGDRAAVLILLEGDEGDLAWYMESVCLNRSCTEWSQVVAVAPVGVAADVIADAEEGLDVDGEGATGVFSYRELQRALD